VIRFSLVCHVGSCPAAVPPGGAGRLSSPPPGLPEACDALLSPSRHRCALLKLCCSVLSLLLLLGFFSSPYAAEVGFRRFDKWCEALDGISIEPRVANFCLEYLLLLFFFLVVVVASSVGFARALQGGSFSFLCDLFGGGTWIRRADFCWRRILHSRPGCSFSLWQATTERGSNQLSTKIHGTVPASWVTGRFILYTVENFSFLQSTSGAVRNRSSLREDV